MFGLFATIVSRQRRSISQARSGCMPVISSPRSRPRAPEKKLRHLIPFGEMADSLSGTVQIFNVIFSFPHAMVSGDYPHERSMSTLDAVCGQLERTPLLTVASIKAYNFNHRSSNAPCANTAIHQICRLWQLKR